MNDQIIKLVLQLVGQGDIQAAIDALKDLEKQGPATAAALNQVEAADTAAKTSAASAAPEIYDLADAYEVLGDSQASVFTTAQQIGPGMKAAAAAASTTASTVGTAATAVGALGKGGTDASVGMKQAQQGFLDMSRATQDFAQGGWGGILNNLEGIGRAIPALMANPTAMFTSLPGLLTIAGTALFIFGGKLLEVGQSITASFRPEKPREFGDELANLKKRADELEKKEIKFPLDTRELDEAKQKIDALMKADAEWQAQQSRQSKAEAESGKLVQEGLDEAPGGAAAVASRAASGLFRDALARSQTIKDANERIGILQAELADPNFAGDSAGIRQDIAALQTKIKTTMDLLKTEADRNYGAIVDRAKKGHGADQALAQQQLAGLTGLGFDTAAGLEATDEADEEFQRHMDAAKAAGVKRRATAATAKKADDAANKVIADTLRDELDVLKGAGTVDQVADELTKEAAAGGLKGESAFAKVKEGVDKRLRDELQREGFAMPAGREAVVAGQVGDLATQAARAARVRAGTAERRAEKKEDKGEQAGLMAEARANEARIDAQVKKINAVVGPSYQKQFESVMATNAGNAALGRPSMDPALLRRQLQQQMAGAMRRRGADEQSANLASKGIAEKGTTDLSRQFAEKTGNNVERTLQVTAQHNQIFAAMIGRVNGQEARLGNVERTAGALLQQVHPRAQHQRRRGQP